jgi:outer membrane protein OmpA-like peptidoglycan-associated protein
MSQRISMPFVLLGAGLLLTGNAANAQTSAKEGTFTVQRFAPAPGPRNFITVEGARTDGKMAFSLGVFANYASDPFVVKSCISQTDCSAANATLSKDIHVVRDMVTTDLLASFTPISRLQIGARFPVFSWVNGDGINTDLTSAGAGTQLHGGLKKSGVGDPMLEAKVRALGGVGDMFVVGAAAFMTAPLGEATAKDGYIGDSSVTTGLRGIADIQVGRFTIGGNLAGVYRKKATLGSSTLGSEMRYGLGAAFKASPIIRVLAESYGTTEFSSKNGTNTMEALLAGQLQPLKSRFIFSLGGGLGVIEGVGVPTWRGFAGIMFVNERSDLDGDGIPDDDDQCQNDPEDFDGFQDEDGCPDPDNDGDGFLDAQDKCPNEPETKNGYKDDDGCPDEVPDRDQDGIPDAEDMCPDNGGQAIVRRKGPYYGCPDSDRDGIPDKIDKCPNEPEDTDGFQDEDGCPDPDNDGDGIPDVDDQCVDQPEVFNGFQDEDGCPDVVPDRDHDGIPDNVDKCPDQPENYNGFEDDDGCPDKGGPNLIEVGKDQIKIKSVINFEKASDKIAGKESFKVLDAMAAALKHHPEIFKVEVGGHTDNTGDKDQNVDLSKRRAASVVTYLTGKGVEAKRLTSAGYGPDKPLASNAGPQGRAANRRVEFQILESAAKPKPSEYGPGPSSAPPAPAPAPAAKPAAAAPAPVPAPKPAATPAPAPAPKPPAATPKPAPTAIELDLDAPAPPKPAPKGANAPGF